jgi:hypothetical protein
MAKTSITAKLGLDTTAFQRGLAKSQKSVDKFVKNGIAKFGAIAGAAGLGSMAKSAIDLGSKISDMAVQLNIGTTELQTLEFASREAGVATEVMARALRNVQLRTEEAIKGNKSYGQAFDQLGINIEEFKKLNTEQKLEEIAKAQAKATDKGAAYNAVARILGEKAGPALQEVLQNLAGPKGYGGLAEAAKRAGEIMSEETIAKMDEAADRIESFKRKMTVVTGSILAGFTTFGERVGQGAAMLVNKVQCSETAFETLPESVDKATDSQQQYSDVIEETTKNVKSLREQIAEYYKEAKKAEDLERAEFLKSKELEALELRAKGEKKAAEQLESKIESMKKAIAIADKYGISLQKAAKLVQNINKNETTASSTGGTGGGATFEGQTVDEAMTSAKEKGIRFQKFVGAGGKTFQQRFVNGRKAGTFTDEQLAAAAAQRPKAKDPAQQAAKQTSLLESIEREIKKNPE